MAAQPMSSKLSSDYKDKLKSSSSVISNSTVDKSSLYNFSLKDLFEKVKSFVVKYPLIQNMQILHQ